MALLNDLNKFIFFLCHTVLCLAPLAASAFLAIQKDWCVTHGFFASMQACVFMYPLIGNNY